LDDFQQRLNKTLDQALQGARRRHHSAATSLALLGTALVQRARHRAEQLQTQMEQAIQRQYERAVTRYRELTGQLRTLDPTAILQRGYAVVQKSGGQAVRSPDEVVEDESLRVLLAHGQLQVRVQSGSENPPPPPLPTLPPKSPRTRTKSRPTTNSPPDLFGDESDPN
jgi:exodeoxyribonuclease VII large subunit